MIEINDASFEEQVENSDKPVLLDFFGPDCAPCRMLAPVLDDIAKEIPGVKFIKMDVFANPETGGKFGVMSIPTLILFLKGKEADRRVGSAARSELVAWVKDVTK